MMLLCRSPCGGSHPHRWAPVYCRGFGSFPICDEVMARIINDVEVRPTARIADARRKGWEVCGHDSSHTKDVEHRPTVFPSNEFLSLRVSRCGSSEGMLFSRVPSGGLPSTFAKIDV